MKTMPAPASASAKAARSDEEAIARMHRLGAGLAARLDDLVDHQIGLRGGGGPDGTASSAMSTWSARASASE